MGRFSLLPGLLLGLFVSTAWGIGEKEQRQFADGLYSRDLHEMSLTEYQKLLVSFPEHAEKEIVWFRMGEAYRKLTQNGKAVSYYNRVILHPEDSEYKSRSYLRKAQMLIDAKRADLALGVLDEMLKGKHNVEMIAAGWYYRGQALKAKPDVANAEKAFRKVADKYTKTAYASYASLEAASMIQQRKGPDAEVLKYFKIAADNPATPQIGAQSLLALGDAHFRKKRYTESSAVFRQLLTKYPGSGQAGQAKLSAAWSEHYVKNYAESLKLVQSTSLEMRKKFRNSWLYLEANCLRQLQRIDEALLVYGALIREFEGSDYGNRSRYEAAMLAYRKKAFREAINFAEPLAANEALKTDALWILAESHKSLGEIETAIKYFKLITANPADAKRHPDALYTLAQVNHHQQKFAPAAEGYVGFVKSYPQNPRAPNALFSAAFCAAKLKDVNAAVARWNQLTQQYAAHELADDSWYQVGLAEIGRQNFAPALVAFRSLQEKHAQSPFAAEAQYWMAVLLEQDKKVDEAEKFFRVALAGKLEQAHQNNARYRLGLILQQKGQLKEAADLVFQVISDPAFRETHPSVLEWAARYWLEGKELDKSILASDKLGNGVYSAEMKQTGFALKAQALLAKGKELEAVKAYHFAVKQQASTREGVGAALYLGEYQLKSQQYTDAAKLFAAAGEQSSELGALDLQARSYFGLGKASEAEQNWKDASRFFLMVDVLFGSKEVLTPEALYRAAECFAKAGKATEQNNALEKLKTGHPDSEWAKKVLEQ